MIARGNPAGIFSHHVQRGFGHGRIDSDHLYLKRIKPQALLRTNDPQYLAVGAVNIGVVDLIGRQIEIPLVAVPLPKPERGLNGVLFAEMLAA
jgi:hypothetical protein